MRPVLDRLRADLIERRLWPVALLLVAAIAATPIVLRHEPEAAPAAPIAAAADAESEPSAETIMSAADSVLLSDDRSEARGRPRDPFAVPARGAGAEQPEAQAGAGGGGGPATGAGGSPEPPAPTPSSSSSSSSSAAPSSSSPVPSPSPSPSTSAGPRSSPPIPSRPAVVEPAEPTTFRLLRTDVRFDGEPLHDLVRLQPMPGARQPVALYLGPVKGGRGAAFVVSSGARVDGEGTCRPRARLCTHLILHPGEQATLVRGEEEHTLRLLRVRTELTTSRDKAERFYERESARGRCVLDLLDYLDYDADTGTLAPHHDSRGCEYEIAEDGMVGTR